MVTSSYIKKEEEKNKKGGVTLGGNQIVSLLSELCRVVDCDQLVRGCHPGQLGVG